ncbi:MAG: ASKHA domain-containing protein [Velocimicrobium sp.]
MKICIDIGTTTIAITAIDPFTNLRIEENLLNEQRFFGVDVISRIKASIEGSSILLQTLIQKNLVKGIDSILKKSGKTRECVDSIIIAANTTMVHLLLGFSCEGLAAYPFHPITLDTLTLPANEVLATQDFSCPVVILPGISAFVGGDIVSGIYAINMDQQDTLSFFLDLGTNGEMALGNKNKILTTSTAAGPAFEGGNIKYGIAAIKGAIYQVEIKNGDTKFKTLQYGRPLGLCGSGIIELTSELLKNKLIDKTGLLCDSYFSSGFPITKSSNGGETIRFFQSDIREIQMAKSAIRVGIKLLCTQYGCNESDIETIYLAGAFGSSTNLNGAMTIGLFPSCFEHKIKLVGNTSLLGAIRYAQKIDAATRLSAFIEKSDVLYLANTPDFESQFIEHLNFD